ncbi:hypothetical protein TL16_g05732 [Triparma laevis f. inornata]|uniref:START domain-containing protein n=1 Tax=Triparma laevis f. inornata TaxID=1714386 RepID=A0A9W7AH52_9STRA|nr:hypothetical protein TL16_g05732 [Triparma laevis f. inornata]
MICSEYATPLFGDGLITPSNVILLRTITKSSNTLPSNPLKGSGSGTRRTSSFEGVFGTNKCGDVGSVVQGEDGKPWTIVLNSQKIACQRQRMEGEKLTKIKGVAKLEGEGVWMGVGEGGVHPHMLYDAFASSDFRKCWDKNMMDMLVAYDLGNNNDVMYQSFRYPAILTNRDALYNRYKSFDEETQSYTIVWRSCCDPSYPHNKNLIRTWTVGAYVIEPVAGDPSSSMLYSFGQIDPFGWLPDWFVTQFSPAALKDLIGKVTKACIAEQTKRYGVGVVPDYNAIRASELKLEESNVEAAAAKSSNHSGIRLSNGLDAGRGIVAVAEPPEHLNPKKKKKMFTRVMQFFKAKQERRKEKKLGVGGLGKKIGVGGLGKKIGGVEVGRGVSWKEQ